MWWKTSHNLKNRINTDSPDITLFKIAELHFALSQEKQYP